MGRHSLTTSSSCSRSCVNAVEVAVRREPAGEIAVVGAHQLRAPRPDAEIAAARHVEEWEMGSSEANSSGRMWARQGDLAEPFFSRQ
jgi:hypothetical protein